MPSSGLNPVNVLTLGDRQFYGSNGYVYELDPATGAVLHSLTLQAGGEETRLATDGQTLFVGVYGQVWAVPLGNWSHPVWRADVSGSIEAVSVLAQGGRLFAAASGFVSTQSGSGGSARCSARAIMTRGWRATARRSLRARMATCMDRAGELVARPLGSEPGAMGYNPVNVLLQGGRLFAGSNGYVYEFNPANGQKLHGPLLLPGPIGAGDYETRLARNGQISCRRPWRCLRRGAEHWTQPPWSVDVGGPTGVIHP